MAGSGDKELEALLKENDSRNRELFKPFNPITGLGAPGPRTKVKIKDHIFPVQYMPDRCVKHNILVRGVLKRGTIKKYITDELGWEYTEERWEDVVYALCMAR